MQTYAFYASMGLTVLATLLYHFAQKSTPQKIDPFVSLLITFLTGTLICLLAVWTRQRLSLASFANANWASFTLGLAVVGIDVGFLLAYRFGWKLNVAAITSNVAVAILLVPLAYLLYREKLTLGNAFGILFCIAGLVLLTRK